MDKDDADHKEEEEDMDKKEEQDEVSLALFSPVLRMYYVCKD